MREPVAGVAFGSNRLEPKDFNLGNMKKTRGDPASWVTSFPERVCIVLKINFEPSRSCYQHLVKRLSCCFAQLLPATGVGIALRLLGEAGVLQENFGQAIITAAFVDDILSLVPCPGGKSPKTNRCDAKERCVSLRAFRVMLM